MLPTIHYRFFLNVVPLMLKGQVLKAFWKFAKEIGTTEAIICDIEGENTSKYKGKFCRDVGTTLRILEDGTPWENKFEL